MTDIQPQSRLQVLAAEINTIKSETQKIMMQSAIAIGRRLTEAKGAVGHGNWSGWLKENVDYSQRTASNLIKLFEEYGDGQGALFGNPANPQSLANLSYTQAVALLGIENPDERAEFIDNHDVPGMSVRELQEAIKDRDEKLKSEIESRQKTGKMYEDLAENYKKMMDNKNKAVAEAAGRADELAKKLAKLQEKAAGSAASSSRIKNLESELARAKKEIKTKQSEVDELKNQPIETVTVEKIPDDVQAEMERLRREVSLPLMDKETQKRRTAFAARFEIVQQDFNALVELLDAMDEPDRLKYGGAAKKMLCSMQEVIS